MEVGSGIADKAGRPLDHGQRAARSNDAPVAIARQRRNFAPHKDEFVEVFLGCGGFARVLIRFRTDAGPP
jgi:hypothetical protein